MQSKIDQIQSNLSKHSNRIRKITEKIHIISTEYELLTMQCIEGIIDNNITRQLNRLKRSEKRAIALKNRLVKHQSILKKQLKKELEKNKGE